MCNTVLLGMLRKFFIVLLVITVCYGEEEIARKKKHRPHHHHLYRVGILYYLTFLAVKVKIVVLIGAVITAFVFFGKMFALLRYGISVLESKKETEKVIIEKPYHDHSHLYSQGFDGEHFPDRSGYYSARNIPSMDLSTIANILHKMNVTELTFNSMGLVKDSCKKRAACEMGMKAKQNKLVAILLWFINDKEFSKYNKILPKNIEDCYNIHSDCIT